jgi:hypothetical protein
MVFNKVNVVVAIVWDVFVLLTKKIYGCPDELNSPEALTVVTFKVVMFDVVAFTVLALSG